MLNTGIFPKEQRKRIIHCSMKTKIMEITITSETVSQNTVSVEMMEEPVTVKVPEIAKKVPRVPNKDKEQTNDEGSVKGREHEIEQTSRI